MKRIWRKMMAGLGVLALFFAQLAVAAYACPTLVNVPMAGMTEVATASAAAPCQKVDQEQANLCKQHCEQAVQSIDTTAPAVIDAPVLPLIAIAVQVGARPAVKQSLQDNLLTQKAGPPLSVRNCRFQI
jgi:hypothetical protein